MKIIICGLGSIGKRHLQNLLRLGEKDILIYRSNKSAANSTISNIPVYSDLEEIIKSHPNVAFITNPTALHIPIALKLAKAGCHLFLEKPISNSLVGIDELQRIAKLKKIHVQIGFMMRYHPAVLQMKQWLAEGKIGNILSIRVCWGEYLPSWHPWEDYRKSYAGKKELGGGPIFTLSHDIDLLSWFIGKPKSIFAFQTRKSSLKILTEHGAEILLLYPNKTLAEVHVDYFQSPPKRTWEIIGDSGKIEYDYYANRLLLYTLYKKDGSYKTTQKSWSKAFKRNDMYISELKYFIRTLKNKSNSNELKDGIENLRILLGVHKSLSERRIVLLSEIT